ncbi:sugar transferase [Anaerosporobacter sp.]
MGRFNRNAGTNLYYIFSDCIFCGIAFILASIITEGGVEDFHQGYFAIWLSFLVVYILSGKSLGIYNVTTFFYADRYIIRVTKSFLIATAVTFSLLYYGNGAAINYLLYCCFLLINYALLLFSAFSMHSIMRKYRKTGQRTLIIGHKERYSKFIRFLDQSSIDIEIVGFVSLEDTDEPEYLGSIKDIERLIHEKAVDQIYIMEKQYGNTIDVQSYINICVDMGVTVRVIVNSYYADGAQSYISSVGTYPVLTYHTVTLNESSRAIKRGIDIIGSSVAILIFSPIMLSVAIAIKMESKGPVIFKQTRVGMNGRNFNMFKFRSMCIDAEEKKKDLMQQNEMEGAFMFKMKDDPRITKVGKFIRKTSLDEFPQFFNVLKGDMSLVGTRPPTLDEVEQYERSHWRRISIKPGITGMWQVNGRSTITDFEEIVELDTEYIDKWDVMMDFKIIFQTVWQMFRRRGAY